MRSSEWFPYCCQQRHWDTQKFCTSSTSPSRATSKLENKLPSVVLRSFLTLDLWLWLSFLGELWSWPIHMQNVKVWGELIHKLLWEQTDLTDCITFPTNVVCNPGPAVKWSWIWHGACICVMQVLECSWDELLYKVKIAEDLDHIIAAHQEFLDAITARSLLDPQSHVSHWCYLYKSSVSGIKLDTLLQFWIVLLQMEKGDKGSTMIRMGVSGWMFLLVPAYPGCPRIKGR